MSPQEEHAHRIRMAEVADLEWLWGDWYDIGWDEEFVAVRRDEGVTVFAPTAKAMADTLRWDFSLRMARPNNGGK